MDHQIIRDHETNRSRGFGFIVFDSEQVVDDLVAKGNLIDLAGTKVSFVEFSSDMTLKLISVFPYSSLYFPYLNVHSYYCCYSITFSMLCYLCAVNNVLLEG